MTAPHPQHLLLAPNASTRHARGVLRGARWRLESADHDCSIDDTQLRYSYAPQCRNLPQGNWQLQVQPTTLGTYISLMITDMYKRTTFYDSLVILSKEQLLLCLIYECCVLLGT